MTDVSSDRADRRYHTYTLEVHAGSTNDPIVKSELELIFSLLLLVPLADMSLPRRRRLKASAIEYTFSAFFRTKVWHNIRRADEFIRVDLLNEQ
jgi:hypothetical protein